VEQLRRSAGYDEVGFAFVTDDFLLATFHEDRTKAKRLLRLFVEAL